MVCMAVSCADRALKRPDGKTSSISYLNDGGQGLFQNGLVAQQLHAQCLLELDGTHLLESAFSRVLARAAESASLQQATWHSSSPHQLAAPVKMG